MNSQVNETLLDGISRLHTGAPMDPEIAAQLEQAGLATLTAKGAYALTDEGIKLAHWNRKDSFGQPAPVILNRIVEATQQNPETLLKAVAEEQRQHGVSLPMAVKLATAKLFTDSLAALGLESRRGEHYRYREAVREVAPIDFTQQLRGLVPSQA